MTDTPDMPKTVPELMFRAIMLICGMSLSANAYFVQLKLSELTLALKENTHAQNTMAVDQASLSRAQEAYGNLFSNHNERITYLERESRQRR